MTVEGVDYAFSKPSAAALVAAGKHFAVRYGGPGTSGKWLTAGELQSLVAAGLTVVANAEGTAGGFVTRSAGVSWATSAEAHFRGLGMPGDRPIYFSVDFNVTAAQWPGVAEALRGAASVIGAGRVGIYGSYTAMVWARRDRLADWFWQTYAWSGGRWAPGNHLEQYRNGVTIGGADCDLTRALVADFGQWPGTPGSRGDGMFMIRKDDEKEVYVFDDHGRKRWHVQTEKERDWLHANGMALHDGCSPDLYAALTTPGTDPTGPAVVPTDEQWASFTQSVVDKVDAGLGDAMLTALESDRGQAALVQAANTAEDN